MSSQDNGHLNATDIMTSDVVCLNEDLDIHECEKILIDKGISGAPVVDLEGHLRGVLSKTDLVSYHYNAGEEEAGTEPAYRVEQGKGSRVIEFNAPSARDVMTPVPCVATEAATIPELAAPMGRREVHRVVICRNRKVVGIVTSMDILKAIAAEAPKDWDPSGFPG
jgi:CBS domain-containing protein